MALDWDDKKMAAQIGARLLALRLASGMTQSQFAKRIGVPQPSYNHWETGRRMLAPKHAISICIETRVTLDYLYLGDASGLPVRLHDAIVSHLNQN